MSGGWLARMRHTLRPDTAAATASQRSSARTAPGDTWYCVRRDGKATRTGWAADIALADIPHHAGARLGDTVEACVVDTVSPVPWDRFAKVFVNRARGIVGIEVALGDTRLRYAPTHAITTNRSFDRTLDRFLDRHGATRGEFASRGRLWALHARQFLAKPGGVLAPLTRGTTTVPAEPSEDEDRVADLADGIGCWMLRNLAADGTLPYKYWPSRGQASPADNAIRRFLATIALARFGEFRGVREVREAATRNLRANLARYYRDIGNGRGAIVEPSGAKLGAAALAALAILESPARREFDAVLAKLTAGIRELAATGGNFRTFFFPATRDGQNWNFYTGEALLFWSEALRRKDPCAPPLELATATFRHCRDRHRRARNPAFVPWHTQACVRLHAVTGHREFADFAFEMNDWLLPMQQWDEVDADLRGRFYDPRHRQYGPPHAASTGAYCEGLADAAALARSVGDARREDCYRRALNRGFRSLRQLQFRDRPDAFYVAHRERVIGALRTEVYDNAVRIDSAGHALAAALKVLEARPGGRRTG